MPLSFSRGYIVALAIFDLDNTLIAGDSDHAWGQFLVEQNLVDADLFKQKNDYYYQQYQLGQLNILEYLEFALQPLTTFPRERLFALREQFVREKILPLITPHSRELLAKHRAAGDYLLIITATNLFVTQPIAAELKVDHIIATEPEQVNGQYTGRIQGIPTYKEGKVVRLHAWLRETGHSLEGSYFYSDSHNDLPLLAEVTYPVAVDPDATLKAHAEQARWPVISLRS